MDFQLGRTNILLLHDGELCDVAGLLDDLGPGCVERRDGATYGDLRAGWDVVIGTGPRMLEFEEALPWGAPMRVAILDEDSPTLRAALRRADIEYLVRRPVHPEALRLLLRHVVYRGPEKRRHARVSIGVPIRFRAAWRRHTALLAELSLTGCRLVSEEELAPGQQLSVQLPPEIAGGRGLRVLGSVLRSHPKDAAPGEERRVAVGFGVLPTRSAERLEEIVALHREGPAVFSEASTSNEDDDRRRHPRHVLSRHIIALGADAAPVLLGRDLSLGGMRVDAHPELELGSALQLAVHARGGVEPLVVHARVARDDGPRGLVLEFEELSPAAREHLAKMVEGLPILELDDEGEHSGVLLSEILSQTQR